MPVNAEIKDGEGSRRAAGVTRRAALKVSLVELVAGDMSTEALTARKLFRGFLVNTVGALEMNVDGSTGAILFSLTAQDDRTIWITAVRLLLEGASLEMDTNDFRRFGLATTANTGLPNGVEMVVNQAGVERAVFARSVVTMGGFYDSSDAELNITNAVSAQSDFLRFDFKFDVPVALVSGSLDFVGIRINDDLTPIDSFRAIGRGSQELNL